MAGVLSGGEPKYPLPLVPDDAFGYIGPVQPFCEVGPPSAPVDIPTINFQPSIKIVLVLSTKVRFAGRGDVAGGASINDHISRLSTAGNEAAAARESKVDFTPASRQKMWHTSRRCEQIP